MTTFPVISDRSNRLGEIRRDMERVYDTAMKELALAREQIQRAEDMLDHLAHIRRSRTG
jgi:hypothetical protein